MVAAGALGVAVVGLGVGEQHARAFQACAGCRLRSLFDFDRHRSEHLAHELGDVAAAGTYDELLNDPAIDVLSIASYDDAHFEQVVAALGAGKHVFVEKPLCRSLEELRTIKDAWSRSADRHLSVNLVLRGAPLYQWLSAAIRTGELGEIFAIDGDYLYGRVEKITQGWRKDVVDYSVMQGGGVHLVDLMLSLTGQRPFSVTATGNGIATRDAASFRYNDFAAATYRFESGLVGRITANFGCVHPHQHVLRVFGTRATFIYDDRGARLQTRREPDASWRTIDVAPLPAGKGVLIPAFVSSIVAGRDRAAGAQREFDLISVCFAADQAMATGSSVTIDYI